MSQKEIEELKSRYTAIGCSGVVELIDFLSSPIAESMQIKAIGSHVLGLEEIENQIFISQEAAEKYAWTHTKSLVIGSHDGSITPLQWLQRAIATFEKLPESKRRKVDGYCGDFAKMTKAVAEGNYTEIDPDSLD